MTPNKEDYLKEIYNLGGSKNLVGNKQIAEVLKVTPASVTEMVGKLGREGLIQYEPYKGSRLTQKGIEEALSLVKGHRLWEVFLIKHLGYSWSEAHEDAELLEHITPARLISRLDTFLNYPVYCPHGNTIPRMDVQLDNIPLKTLDTLLEGESSHIRIVIEETELLNYLQDIGIEIGSQIKMISVEPYEGPLVIELNGREVQISYKAACQIYVD